MAAERERIPLRNVKDFNAESMPSDRARHAQEWTRHRHELRITKPTDEVSHLERRVNALAYLATLSAEEKRLIKQHVSSVAKRAERQLNRNMKPYSHCEGEDG